VQDHDAFGQDGFLADANTSNAPDAAPSPSVGTRTPPPQQRSSHSERDMSELPSSASGRLLPPSTSESGRLQWGGDFAPAAGWHPSHYVIELDDANFERQVLASQLPVVVDFWAEQCVPCRRQEESLQQLGQTLFGRVRVGRLNVYRNPETTKRYQIKGVPHLLIVRQGEVLQELVGDHTLADLVEVLAKHGIE
jgi:thioredoxin